MPLIDRFTRLVSADLHALIDRIEEPELLLRQAVRELDDELDVCFRSGEEALARGLVRRKLETERRAKLNAARREAALKAHAELEATLAEDARTLEQMRQKLDVLTADPGRRDRL